MSEPLRIAVVSVHTSPLESPGGADAGGMNVVVLEQSLALARAGHRVDLFTRRADPAAPAIVEVAPGVRLHHLDGGPAAPLAKSLMEQAIDPFREDLRAHLSTGELPDVIHSHHWFSGVAALPIARELGIPHLQSFHSVAAPQDATGLEAGEPAESSGRIPGERLVARESDLVIAVSQAEARTIQERYDVDASRIRIVRPGVDVERFSPAGDPQTRRLHPTLLFAARLQPLKAPDLALEILARLAPVDDARLVLSGGVSEDFQDYRAELEDLAAQLHVADRVELAGSQDREGLAALMREAGILLLTSWSETFGLVALEAQASGTPVIAWTCAGGVQEAIGPGGIVLPSRDPDVWAEAVASLLADPERYAEACASARAFALTRTWDASAEQLAGIYAGLAPWSLLGSARRVLLVHAHPDDESLATGALIADLASRGVRVELVTATRGEEGEIVPGAIPPGSTEPLEAVRAAEIDAAARALGISRRHMLGEPPALAPGASPRRYRDSGMTWVREGLAGPSPTAGPDSFSRSDLAQESADLAALIGELAPDAVIGYDDAGTYGHPDHVRAHHVTAAACAAAGVPMIEASSEPRDTAPPGFVWREQPGFLAAVRAALEAYRTQLTVVGTGEDRVLVRHVGGQDQEVEMRTGLRLRATPAEG
ncbi:glycosyltransferase [Brachybacterium hainanense]|uniref:D-inositol 3-phosphate glycosyltransferase n=1 Tax=Brachybacterium hainanense TaxID=1541174 RepID=A0ABV6RBL5_9MICO